MESQMVTSARQWMLVSVAVTSTPTSLLKLVNAAIVSVFENNAERIEKTKGNIIQVILAANADITITDEETAATKTLASGVEKTIPALNALEAINVSTATTATLKVELYYQ